MLEIKKIFRQVLQKLKKSMHKKPYAKSRVNYKLVRPPITSTTPVKKDLPSESANNGSKENIEMEDMENLELAAMQIISNVGTARSAYIEAIHEAKKGNYEQAEAIIKEGDEAFAEGHDAHLKLLQQEAEGKSVVMLLILHAEDQLMSAEGFKIIATELIDVYKQLNELQK